MLVEKNVAQRMNTFTYIILCYLNLIVIVFIIIYPFIVIIVILKTSAINSFRGK